MQINWQRAPPIVMTGLWLTLAVVLGVCYPFYHRTSLLLTLEQPFTAWADVRNAFKALAGQAVPPTNNISQAIMAAAWCNYSSVRPNIGVQNRSAACACLWGKQAALYNSSNGTFLQAQAYQAADDALSCMRLRGVWNIWPCGKYCRVHPIALALTCNLCLGIVCLALVLLDTGLHKFLAWGVLLIPASAGISVLLAIKTIENFAYAALILAAWGAVVVGLDGELGGRGGMQRKLARYLTADPADVQALASASPLMTAIWSQMPVVTGLLSINLAITGTVRDIVGILCYACLGALTGLFAQRAHWNRWHMDATPLGRILAPWAAWIIGAGLASGWVALLTLAYTQWYPSPPSGYLGPSTAIVWMALLGAMHLAEAVNTMVPKLAGAKSNSFGACEIVQLCLLSSTMIMFSVIALVDGAQ